MCPGSASWSAPQAVIVRYTTFVKTRNVTPNQPQISNPNPNPIHVAQPGNGAVQVLKPNVSQTLTIGDR